MRLYHRLPKILLWAIVCGLSTFCTPSSAHAASSTRTPAASGDCTLDTSGAGTVAWTNPGDAFSDNATYASASVDGTSTDYIKCLNYGFSIPAGSTIDGIVVPVERKSSSTGNGGSNDLDVYIVKGGTIGATDKATATTYTTSDASEDHGGTTDLWGQTWTVSDINAANFGVAFSSTKASSAGAAHTVTVDVASITVHYSVPLTIGGVVRGTTEGSGVNGACDSSTAVVSVRVNGGTAATGSCNTSTGIYSITTSEPAPAGSTITVYLTSSQKANLVMVSSGSDVSSADLYQDRVIVRDEQDGDLNILDTLDYDNTANGTDMLFDAVDSAPDTFTVDSGAELHIWTGDTFAPAGTVTTTATSTTSGAAGDLHIDSSATLSMGTNALVVGGDYLNSGTFSKSSGQTTTFTATGTGFTITPGTGNFDSVTFNGSGGGWSFAATTTIDVDLAMTAGMLSGTSSVNVNGGDVTGNGTINITGGTFLVDAASGTGFGGNTAWNFNNLTFGDGSGTTTTTGIGTGDITVTGDLVVAAAQTLAGSSARTFFVNGIVSGAGTINLSGGTFDHRVSAAKNFGSTSGSNNWTFSDLTFSNGHASSPFTITAATGGSGSIIVSGSLAIGKAGDASGAITTLDNETNDRILDVNGAVSISSKGVLQASSTASFTVADNWTNSGTFTANSGTVTMDAGASGKTFSGTLTGSTGKFYNLTFNNASGGWSFGANAGEVANHFLLTTGAVTASSTTLTLGKNFTYSGGSFSHNSGTVVLNTTATAILDGSTTFNNLTCTTGPKTIQFQENHTFTTAGALTINGSAGNIITLTRNGSTLRYTLSVASSTNVSYVNVANSNASGANITADLNSTNNGNNDDLEGTPHWIFMAEQPSTTSQGELLGGAELRGGSKIGV